jgi:hypothetical protein
VAISRRLWERRFYPALPPSRENSELGIKSALASEVSHPSQLLRRVHRIMDHLGS